MVRQPKQTPDQKDTHKKKTQQHDRPATKKSSDAAVWPCTISGCNKQFAREADLKRHQRTTKLHSVPGFACPQCDARFTRTDALRRHQKSRHNGVVIEPNDGVDRRTSMDEDPHSSGSRSKSRSRTPSKENPTVPTSMSPTSVPPGGPQSYYRQHTFAGVMVPPPGMTADGHYSPAIGLPTSATRLHQASWDPPAPWPTDGSQPPPPHMMHPGYPNPYYSAPPQYYRPESMMHLPNVVPHQIPNGIRSSHNGESSSRKGSPVIAVDPSLHHEDPTEPGDADTAVIDPSLVSPSPSNSGNRESSADGQVPRIRGTTSPGGQHISSPCAGESINEDGNGTDSDAAVIRHLLSPGGNNSYSSPHSAPLERPPEMEQILTEDGEPMLNPAELLTQESLASPPPS